MAALVLFATAELYAVNHGITDNILWAPTTPRRAAVLLATLLPFIMLAVLARSAWWRRAAERRDVSDSCS